MKRMVGIRKGGPTASLFLIFPQDTIAGQDAARFRRSIREGEGLPLTASRVWPYPFCGRSAPQRPGEE